MILPFCLALFAACFQTAFLPHIHVMPFAPFLALIFQQKSFTLSLWAALGCGIVMDLLSNELRFGMYSLNFVLVTLILHRQKRHFFEGSARALALFTALISLASTLISMLFLGKVILIDLISMPILDALYAFLWFTCPSKLWKYKRPLA